MRIAINGSGEQTIEPSVTRIGDHIERAAKAGFHGYWLAQTGLSDALLMLTANASRRGNLEVGTAVIPTFPRHPTALAAQALTAQAALGGNLVLGIGLSHRPSVEDRWGLSWDRPLRHMRDYLDVLLPLLSEGTVEHKGDIWSAAVTAVRPTTQPPSVMLAALGPQMLDLAGRRTDGTILWLVGPRTIREHIAPRLNDAAAAAGRAAPRVVCSLPVCVTDDATSARQTIGSVLASYNDLPSYRAMLDREGAAGPGDVAIVGDEAAVTEQLAALADAGTTDFAALPLAFDTELVDRTWSFLAAYPSP